MGLVAILGWILVLHFLFIFIIEHESKCGEQHIRYTCAQVKANRISGSLCHKLCDDQYFTSSKRQCLAGNPSKQILQFLDWPGDDLGDIVVKFRTQWYQDFTDHLAAKFNLTHHAKRLCLQETQNVKLCDVYVATLMTLTDSNTDGQIDDIEAATVSTLLKNREFFMLTLLHKSALIPELVGFCGGMYAVESVDYTVEQVVGTTDHLLDVLPIQGLDVFVSAIPESILESAQPLAHLYFDTFKRKFLPSRRDEVWLTNQFFVVLKRLADFNGIHIHMCDIHWANFGVMTRRGTRTRLVLLDFDSLFPTAAANHKLQSTSCDSDDDCAIGDYDDCMSRCDSNLKTCGAELNTQNLNILCRNLLIKIWMPALEHHEDDLDRSFPYTQVVELFEKCTSLPLYEDSKSYIQDGIEPIHDSFQAITGHYD
ncbi:divergent protein kinase domain 1A-like [Ptychodera flava]|uniref:divergent protein kinase domain 1A-like n=1 Tax=Ptychodera flava TaxID=63121 RepID=UPI003969E449